MADQTLLSSSPDTDISRENPELVLPPSSPLLPIGSQCSSKPKKGPTVTPRTFTRFFTPRSSLRRGKRIGASRQALRDITASSASNRSQRISSKDTVLIFEDGKEFFPEIPKKRKKQFPVTPDTTPSPIKRIRHQSLDIPHEIEGERTDSEDGLVDVGSEKYFCWRKPRAIDPIKSNIRGRLGWSMSREIGGFNRPRLSCDLYHGADWQCETSTLFASPEDTHVCAEVADPEENAIPFCTTSCNTNSLVAVGDEEGGVRLLESARNGKPGFSKAYLTFRPHTNAIMDLSFSPDDLLLATASGDQTAQIIDMPTQCPIYTLAGHTSSVKQTRFQPGSSNVIATSSRDGSVQIWDLRCKGFDAPSQNIKVSLEPPNEGATRRLSISQRMTWARPVNIISDAHSVRQLTTTALSTATHPLLTSDTPSKTEPPSRRGDVSVTALTFLHQDREHILLTASEANASVKVWDIRTTHTHRRRTRPVPLSTTLQPESHTSHRQFGLTSLALSGDGSRLYTLCRDNTIYAYATSHLILGHAPELSLPTSRPRRAYGAEKEGLGPLYGFRHPKFHATTFYVKCALRPAVDDKSEVLAVGSSDGCAVLFPTDERYLRDPSSRRMPDSPSQSFNPNLRTPPPTLRRTASSSNLTSRLMDTIPIYQHGTALVRGHSREVTGLTWTKDSDLVSIADDCNVRCWREGYQGEARGLRTKGEGEGRRWGCGWAEVHEAFDVQDP